MFSFLRRQPQTTPTASLAHLAQAIAQAFLSQGLPVALGDTVQGARVITQELHPVGMTRAQLRAAEDFAPMVEVSLRQLGIPASPCRVVLQHGALHIEIPSPWPVKLDGLAPYFAATAMQAIIGLCSTQEVVGVDLAHPGTNHLFIVGPSGHGKTSAARMVVYRLIAQNSPDALQVLIVTGRPQADWDGLVETDNHLGTAHVQPLIPPHRAGWLLDKLTTEVARREAQGITSPRLICLVDDLPSVIHQCPDTVKLLEHLSNQARAAGVHLILCAQRRNKGYSPILANIHTRVVLGAQDAQEAAFFVGVENSGADRLMGEGDAIFRCEGHLDRIQTALVRNADFLTLPRGFAPALPWLEEAEPPVTTEPVITTRPERGMLRLIGPASPPTKPVITSYEPVTGGSQVVTASSGVTTISFPLPRRDPTANERRAIRFAYHRLGSKNATIKEVWGGKNADTWRWLHEAIEGTAP